MSFVLYSVLCSYSSCCTDNDLTDHLTHFKLSACRNNNEPDLLEHPLVKQIARYHEKSPAQVLLRHLIQQGIIVIPKSANPMRIKENGQVPKFMLLFFNLLAYRLS
jgi:diketogulonate reductase-like aldo/keto reductase